MTFNNFNLHSKILQAVSEAGYSEPTEIQIKAMPKIMQGFDIRGSAQTGSGKTGAYLLPALNQLASPSSKTNKGPRLLILVPTRELAMQVAVQAEKYSKYLHQVKAICIIGGVPYHAQIRKLSRPHDILIATPGRLIDFIQQGKINFSRLEMLILDEADRMLDMGFMEPVEQIVAKTPPSRQTLLFSATLNKSVMKLSERLLKKPMDIIIAEQKEYNTIEQKLYYVEDQHHKNSLLDSILKEENVNRVIVFTSTKHHADQLVGQLNDKNFQAAALHGNMNQRQRTKTITKFRNDEVKILVATDIASRGIDIQSITHVINYDIPRNGEDYTHRIGRTGRAGSKGIALSFAARRDVSLVKKIEAFTGQQIQPMKIDGFESPPPQKRHFKPKKHFTPHQPFKARKKPQKRKLHR